MGVVSIWHYIEHGWHWAWGSGLAWMTSWFAADDENDWTGWLLYINPLYWLETLLDMFGAFGDDEVDDDYDDYDEDEDEDED